jgi:hypothetical protein
MRLLNFTVLDRRPVGGGTPVDNAAAYERLDCRALLRIDPGAAENAGIVDLDIAPRDADGLVAFATQVQILKPVEAEAGSRRLFVELCNRGNKRCLQFFNDARGTNDPITCADMGNGFLLRRGYTSSGLRGRAIFFRAMAASRWISRSLGHRQRRSQGRFAPSSSRPGWDRRHSR